MALLSVNQEKCIELLENKISVSGIIGLIAKKKKRWECKLFEREDSPTTRYEPKVRSKTCKIYCLLNSMINNC